MAMNKSKQSARLDFSEEILKTIQPPVASRDEEKKESGERGETVSARPVITPVASENVTASLEKEEKSNISFSDDLLESAEKLRKQRGVQKNIYMDYDCVEYINALSAKTGVPFSKIANMMIKKAIQLSKAEQ